MRLVDSPGTQSVNLIEIMTDMNPLRYSKRKTFGWAKNSRIFAVKVKVNGLGGVL